MLEEFPYESGTRQKYIPPLLFNTVVMVLANAIREDKIIRGKRFGKDVEVNCLYLYTIQQYNWKTQEHQCSVMKRTHTV